MEAIKPITLEVLGIQVLSEIVRDEELNGLEGGKHRYIVIRSSCPSKRWGRRSTDFHHSSPLGLPNFRQSLQEARQTAAEALVKQELGLIPDRSTPLLGIRLSGPTGKSVNTIASINLMTVPTLVSADLLRLLALKPSGGLFWEKQDDRWVAIPLFSGKAAFGGVEHEVEFLPAQTGFPCVLGAGYIHAAVKDVELVQELLIPNHRRAVVNAARSKKNCVLILGRYGEHRDRLVQIKKAVETNGYVGVILDEEPDIEEQSLPEKVVLYGAICRFVVVDDFAPSGHISELAICSERRFTTALLRRAGIPATALQGDIADEVQFMRVFEYDDETDIEKAVVDATRWADDTVLARAHNLNRKYQWRTPYSGVVRVPE